MIQRAKLGMAAGFLRPISALVNIGYKSLAVKKTGYNVATAQVIAEAIIGDYPTLEIDYPNVLIPGLKDPKHGRKSENMG